MAPDDSTQSVPNAPLAIGSGQHLTLHLGILVQPYRAKSAKAAAMTTGDVAEILEAKYGLMAAFYRVHETDVAQAIETSLEGALESLLMQTSRGVAAFGQAVDPWGRGMQLIQQEFRDFINSKEAERVGIPGVPTKAALRGVSHRRKHPYAGRNPRRPSFRDTGLLVSSFRSWVD
jgi:hypothetical protein